MKIVILDAQTLGEDLDLSSLDQFGKIVKYQTTSPEQTQKHIADADIVITNKVVIGAEHMDSAKNLKLVCISATGMNNVDLDYAKEKNIEVKNVAGYSTKSVVQHTFAMALYLIEKMAYYDSVVKSKEWTNSELFTDVSKPFFEISGKKWGLIGLGSIGREVASVATAFGAEVCYYSTSGKNHSQPYTRLNLDEMLSTCDIISIHSPLNDKTNNLIDAEKLKLLKNGAVLLNLGRGSIINEAALAVELDKRDIYAGLDVLTPEPIALDNPLMSVKNQDRLLITPHIAWSSSEARVKLLEGIVTNIAAHMKNA